MVASDSWQVTKSILGNGVKIYSYFEDDSVMPLGFVWGIGFHGTKRRFEVLGSYVLKHCRREGIRSKINQKIFESYEVIATFDGTREGRAFMRANGYKFDKKLDQWYKVKNGKRK